MARHFSLASTIFVLVTLAAMGPAKANGALRMTFKFIYNNGIEQPFPYAYLYLRNSSSAAPMEKDFAPADYIFGPAHSSGKDNAFAPEGEYYCRFTRRNLPAGSTRPNGPSEPGDQSWSSGPRFTLSANTVTDLGIQYVNIFGTPPIIITGVVRDEAGNPLADRYVWTQPELSLKGYYTNQNQEEWVEPNYCSPTKHLAQERTDADGSYTILIRNPGNYYITISETLGDLHELFFGNPGTTGRSINRQLN